MNRNILVAIENTKTGPCANSPADIASVFRASSWVEVAFHGGRARIRTTHLEKSIDLNPSLSEREWLPSELYLDIAKALPEGWQFFRVRNFQYPLTSLFAEEISADFPPEFYNYVISTAERALLSDFFIERLSVEQLDAVQGMKLTPSGYFNAATLAKSGRHFPSQKIALFYLNEHFETMLASPRQINVDIMPACNYSCSKCHFHSKRWHHGPVPFDRQPHPQAPMPLSTVKEILKRVKKYSSIKEFHPYMTGEPLLHPEIIPILHAIRDSGFYPGFSTNAALLTEDMGRQLWDAGIKYVAFSVDALTQDVYGRLQGGSLKTVERNMMAWQELCLKRDNGNFCGSVMFVVNPDNADQMDEFYDRWTARGFSVSIQSEMDIHTRKIPVLFPKFDDTPKYCAIFTTLYIDSSANVLGCCAQCDYPSQQFQLNFLDMPPDEIWRRPILNKFRNDLLSGKKFDFCMECPGGFGVIEGTWVQESNKMVSKANDSFYSSPPSDWKERSDWLCNA